MHGSALFSDQVLPMEKSRQIGAPGSSEKFTLYGIIREGEAIMRITLATIATADPPLRDVRDPINGSSQR
jgi:hypothetical protein